MSDQDLFDLRKVQTDTYQLMGLPPTEVELSTFLTQCIWMSGFHHSLDHQTLFFAAPGVRNNIPYFTDTTSVEVQLDEIVGVDTMRSAITINKLLMAYLPTLDRTNSVLAANLPSFLPLATRRLLEDDYKRCVTTLVAASHGTLSNFVVHRSICY